MKVVCLIVILGLCIFMVGVVGGVCWPYVINTWLVYAGKEPTVTFWQGFLVGLVPGLGQFCLPCVVLTWVLMMIFG